ncbi:MAG: hypothetical protein RIT22_121 [Bacteroidota bacterium]|jgi:hypothetical protein
MQLNFLMVQLTYLNLNREKRLSYISSYDLYDLYGLKNLTTKTAKPLDKLSMTARRLTK